MLYSKLGCKMLKSPVFLQEELGQLRELWDAVSRIMTKVAEWKAMLWGAINVDFLIEETKKLIKEAKALNKAIRAFPAYKCGPKDLELGSSMHH